MDYDVMYIPDERNATNDHRTQGSRGPIIHSGSGWSPGNRTVVVPPGSRPTVITTGGVPNGYAMGPGGYYYRPQVMVAQPPLLSRFGMTTGELIDTGLQILTAISPLPAAPTAQGDAGTDVENLVTYQGALWQHAKRDEQLRTLGNLLVRILK